jgi:hypothetical protein
MEISTKQIEKCCTILVEQREALTVEGPKEEKKKRKKNNKKGNKTTSRQQGKIDQRIEWML